MSKKQKYYVVWKGRKTLRQNDYDTPIIKWETSEWGEIPADYGRK